MKSLIINSKKNKNRHSSINLDCNSKIKDNEMKEIPSLFGVNKTIQKYINEKLNLLKGNIEQNKASKEHLRNNNINIIKTKKNLSFNKITKNKSANTNKKNKIKGRNNRHDHHLFENEFKTNDINFKFNDIPNLLNNSKFKSKENLKKKISEKINNLIKNKENILSTTKGKLVKDFYQNYSSSMSASTGISLNHNNEIIYKENNKNTINDNNTINSKNNYEIDSIEEDNIHEIIFKGINQGSPITFGNSFSYTNSKRSINSNKEEKEDKQEKMDKSVLLLKNQNETLKKELKESNQQITYLKNEIEKLLKKKQMNITNYKCNVNIINKKQAYKPKIFSKNSSYLDKINYDIDKSHYNSEIRIIKKCNNTCNYKMKLLKKNKKKIGNGDKFE